MTRFLGLLVCSIVVSIAGAAQADTTIICPAGEVEVEIVDQLPVEWNIVPGVAELTDTRVDRRRGPDSLQCVYGTSGTLEIAAPRSETCTPAGFGFQCVSDRTGGFDEARGSRREREAETVARDFFAFSSRLTAESLNVLETVYADEVDYFGKLTKRSAILRDKKSFIARWPDRSYTIIPGSLDTDCRRGFCEVIGVVDFSTHSRARNARSEGTARFRLGLSMRDEVRVTLETSEVLTRR